MNRRFVIALIAGAGLAAVVVIAAARPSPNDGPNAPGDSQARALLADTYAAARQAPDSAAFCQRAYAPPLCAGQYDARGGRAAVPAEPPTVVESRLQGAARVLTVCGVDGKGQTYRADFPVEYENGNEKPYTVLPVFWESKTYSGNQADDEPVQVSPGPQRFSC